MKDKLDTIVHMTPVSSSASWWALFLLELGKNSEYDLLLHYLTLAQKNGCLQVIRLAAEKIARKELRTISQKVMPGPRKAVKRKTVAFKAVA